MSRLRTYGRSVVLTGLLALGAAGPACAGETETEVTAIPAAGELIGSVIAGFPAVPITISAELQSRNSRGDVEKKLNVEIMLDWHGRIPSARYTIRDAFGKNLEGLTVKPARFGKTSYRYFRGEALVASPLPDLSGHIQDTDFTWNDLSLSFLWWPDGQTVGIEEIKGRRCYVADLPAPDPADGGDAGMRVWIDPQAHMLLQAAAFDSSGARTHLLQIKSFKKINKVWMIQNLDMQSFPSGHKTVMRVRQVETPEDKAQKAARSAADTDTLDIRPVE